MPTLVKGPLYVRAQLLHLEGHLGDEARIYNACTSSSIMQVEMKAGTSPVLWGGAESN
jgi:hypothetical protein